ncbi:MAG: molybdopterin molybdotransferase MoeA [Candidatus Limnocylindria bacterium]
MPISATSAKPAQKLMSADDALARILEGVPALPAVETPILEALGLVLAEDVAADRDVPPFRNSAMDGYAVRGDDVTSAPVELRVVGEVAAGGFPDRAVGPGEAMRVMTGAPMPDGTDTVVRVEDTDNASDVVTITAATPKGLSTRQAGEDLRKGETILTKGTVLRAAEIGLLASVGHARVRVRKRPRVAVFSTGDEIVDLDAPLGRGQIRDANRYTLASAIRAAGAEPWVRGIVRDSPDALRAALREGTAADAIVTSGGVSVGDHDHLKPVLSELGTIEFWAIAIRPGRPLAFGGLRDGDRRVPIFGLPGNTVSALLTFEIFVRPALLRMQSRENVARPRARARLAEPIDKLGPLRFFARGIHDPEAGTVRLTGPQGSGILRSMSLANCLIDLPVGRSRIEKGEIVDLILTEQPEPTR